jgi:hypothetical protein
LQAFALILEANFFKKSFVIFIFIFTSAGLSLGSN